MKIPKALENAINVQINNELSSSYLYLSMAAWFETTIYSGFSSWMQKQSDEERDHAMRFFKYLNDRQGTVKLEAIVKPATTFKSPLDAFKQALASELKTTKQIHAIYDLAETNKDWETKHFLSWFLQEQVEEEKSANDWVDRLTLADEHVNALMRLDSEAQQRQDV